MKDITPQQQKVLDCIQVYLNKTGFPPTRADICRELGFKSPNSAETHLRALEKKGFITIESGTSRGISITNPEIIHEDNEYPIVINTSFNLKDQTITMTPDQAIKRFINSKINFLVIGNYLLTKDIK